MNAGLVIPQVHQIITMVKLQKTFLACSKERNDGSISVLRLYLSCHSRSSRTWGSDATKNYQDQQTINMRQYWADWVGSKLDQVNYYMQLQAGIPSELPISIRQWICVH